MHLSHALLTLVLSTSLFRRLAGFSPGGSEPWFSIDSIASAILFEAELDHPDVDYLCILQMPSEEPGKEG